jgi:hypothetical protein
MPKFECLLEDKQGLSLGVFDISQSYLISSVLFTKFFCLNLCINVYLIIYLLDLVLLLLWFVFCRKTEKSRKNLTFEGLYTARAQLYTDLVHSTRPRLKLARPCSAEPT